MFDGLNKDVLKKSGFKKTVKIAEAKKLSQNSVHHSLEVGLTHVKLLQAETHYVLPRQLEIHGG